MLKVLVNVAWMATLFFLIGLVGGPARTTVSLTVIAVGVVLAVVLLTPLVAPGWTDWIGLALGVLTGGLFRSPVRSFSGV